MEMHLQCQLGCAAGGHDSRSGRPDRQPIDRVRYTGNAEVQIRKEFPRNSVCGKHITYLDQRNDL